MLGKEDNNVDVIEKEEKDDGKDFKYISINKLFDDDDNNNRDGRNNDIIEKEEKNDVPFILPFNAVPFP